MATSRTPVGKKTTSKTASNTKDKKPLAKKTIAVKPATKPQTIAKKASPTPAKKTTAAPAKKVSAPLAGKIAVIAKGQPKKMARKITVSPEERYHMIATAAYFLAERHGFNSCYAMKDWITAEAEIDAKLNAQK